MNGRSRMMVVSPLWLQVAILTFLIGFAVLGILADLIAAEHPPIPRRVLRPNVTVLFTGDDVMAGQHLFHGAARVAREFKRSAYDPRTGDLLFNWPPELLAGNRPTADAFLWSVLSLIALLGGVGVILFLFDRFDLLGWHRAEEEGAGQPRPHASAGQVCSWSARDAAGWSRRVVQQRWISDL